MVSVPSFASHPAVCGQPYKNLSVKCVNVLDKFTCGVQLYVLGHHSLGVDRLLRNLVRDNLWQKFEVIGEFGLASDDFTIYGKLREKSTYTHIRKKALEQVIQVFTRGQRKLLFQQLNVSFNYLKSTSNLFFTGFINLTINSSFSVESVELDKRSIFIGILF